LGLKLRDGTTKKGKNYGQQTWGNYKTKRTKGVWTFNRTLEGNLKTPTWKTMKCPGSKNATKENTLKPKKQGWQQTMP